MRTLKAGMVVAIAVLLTLAAGVTAGVLLTRAMQPAPRQGQLPAVHPALSEELRLTPGQKEQMREIWEGVQNTVQQCYQEAWEIQQRREDAMQKLLTPEQKASFEKIADQFKKEFDQVVDRRQRSFQQAVARTRTILNDDQRKTYDSLVEKRLGKSATRPKNPADLLVPPATTHPGP